MDVSPPSILGTWGKGRGPAAPRVPPLLSSLSGERQEGAGPSSFLPRAGSQEEGGAPLWARVLPSFWPVRPNNSPRPPGTPSVDLIIIRCISEPFRRPNTIIIYINLYLQTIPKLLVMSVISSGTLNNIRSATYITHTVLYRQRTLSVRTLRDRELCRHDGDTSPVNNQ